MIEGEKKDIDPKLALLIEQTEESLRKMEKTLGPEHVVVGKILDTYAKLLRQNNHRLIDAVNMEARAKAIRAKHNQEESEAQARMIDETPAGGKAPAIAAISTTQVKLFTWLFAIVVGGILVTGAMQTMKSVTPTVAKLKALKAKQEAQRFRDEVAEARANATQQQLPFQPQPQPQPQLQFQPPPLSQEEIDAQEQRRAEAEKERENVRQEIAQLVTHGQEFEAAGNNADAEEAYRTAITAASQAPAGADGRPFASQELATALDRYSNLLEARGETGAAEEMRKRLQLLLKGSAPPPPAN